MTSSSKPRLCIDIDNVIAQTDEVLRRVIRLHSRQNVDLRYEDVHDFDYGKCVDIKGRSLEAGEWDRIHLEFTLHHLNKIEPVPGVAEFLRQLSARFRIHLATSRLEKGKEATISWLKRHGIPYDELHTALHRQKHKIDRTFFAAVDDDAEQARLFHESGTTAFVLAHPWNVIESKVGLHRVATWGDLVIELMKLEGNGPS